MGENKMAPDDWSHFIFLVLSDELVSLVDQVNEQYEAHQ